MSSRRKSQATATVPFHLKGSCPVAIVVSQWHPDITSALLKGAVKTLKEAGIANEDILIKQVPGSFEIPQAAKRILKSAHPYVSSVICLGCIIQGETPHFDYIAKAVTNGIMSLSLKYDQSVSFGVLTTRTLQQAKERSGGKYGNKGGDAALAALQMLEK